MRMLCHVLRGPTDGPAYSSLVFAINTLQFPGRVGRPQTNLFSLIRSDLNDRKIFLNNLSDLLYFRDPGCLLDFRRNFYPPRRWAPAVPVRHFCIVRDMTCKNV